MYLDLQTYAFVVICWLSNVNVHRNMYFYFNILTNRFGSSEGGVGATIRRKKPEEICKCNCYWTGMYLDLQTYAFVVICWLSNVNVHRNM